LIAVYTCLLAVCGYWANFGDSPVLSAIFFALCGFILGLLGATGLLIARLITIRRSLNRVRHPV
jgi:hypothetical protein